MSINGHKQKKREWLRYRDFVLSPYGVIKIKSLGYKLKVWQEHSPYLFIHTPDIGNVFPLALAIWPLLEPVIAACPPRPDWPQQEALF
ncbi:hypothetical protein [Symbiopectobacterium sp. RP]|uniref:hypothetical protein n=1 Tax=Symbiopectobacterium sp. RP TaxID=3248553 RepID=UPI003D2A5E83